MMEASTVITSVLLLSVSLLVLGYNVNAFNKDFMLNQLYSFSLSFPPPPLSLFFFLSTY